MSTPEPRSTYAGLMRAPGVPLLFGLSLAHVLGSSLQMFALSVVVYEQTGSAAWSSTAFAAGFLPQLLGGALLTSLADRLPARPVLVISAAIRAAVALLLCLGELSPALAIGVVALTAVWQPLPQAVQSALVSRLLTGDLYVLGRSVFNVISYGAQLLGLALGGAVIAALGAPSTFGTAAGIQVLGLVAALAIPVTGLVRPEGRWSPGETWRGNLELLRDRVVRRLLLSWWVPITLLVAGEAIIVAYVGERGDSPESAGLLLAAFPAGALLGDLVVGRWVSPHWRRRSVPWLFVLVGLPLLPLAWGPSTPVTLALFAVASAATAYQLGGQQDFVDALPADRRGLAFGLLSTGMMTGQGLGPVVAGILADLIGAAVTLSVMGGLVVLAAVWLARLPSSPSDRRPEQVFEQA